MVSLLCILSAHMKFIKNLTIFARASVNDIDIFLLILRWLYSAVDAVAALRNIKIVKHIDNTNRYGR